MGYISRILLLSVEDKTSRELLINNSYLEEDFSTDLEYDYEEYWNTEEMQDFIDMLEFYDSNLSTWIYRECKFDFYIKKLFSFSELHQNLIIKLLWVGEDSDRRFHDNEDDIDVAKWTICNGKLNIDIYSNHDKTFKNYQKEIIRKRNQ